MPLSLRERGWNRPVSGAYARVEPLSRKGDFLVPLVPFMEAQSDIAMANVG